MTKRILVIFYRNPVVGKVKTRLAAGVGEEKALEVYQSLTAITRQVTDELPVDKVVFYSEQAVLNDLWDDRRYLKQHQQGQDLGRRMQNAFSWCFRTGYTSACVIGTDCYELTSNIIMKAYDFLDEGDVIVGPAQDGGYYLLGMNRLHVPLFKDKAWGTHTVLDDTIQDLQKAELQYGLLPVLRDVDEEEDLDDFYKMHHS